jgi:hypothetical protein
LKPDAHHPWELYQSVFFQVQQKTQAEARARGGHKFRFKNKLMSLDGSIIELSAIMFDGAMYRQRKGAIKLHLLIEPAGRYRRGRTAMSSEINRSIHRKSCLGQEWIRTLNLRSIFV